MISGSCPRPKCIQSRCCASNSVHNVAVYGAIRSREVSKANCINRLFGAGDGNRTHARNLGRELQVESICGPLRMPLRAVQRLGSRAVSIDYKTSVTCHGKKSIETAAGDYGNVWLAFLAKARRHSSGAFMRSQVRLKP
jgi:hypothetical protein